MCLGRDGLEKAEGVGVGEEEGDSPAADSAGALAVIGAHAKVHPYVRQRAISPGEDMATGPARIARGDLALVARSAAGDRLQRDLVL